MACYCCEKPDIKSFGLDFEGESWSASATTPWCGFHGFLWDSLPPADKKKYLRRVSGEYRDTIYNEHCECEYQLDDWGYSYEFIIDGEGSGWGGTESKYTYDPVEKSCDLTTTNVDFPRAPVTVTLNYSEYWDGGSYDDPCTYIGEFEVNAGIVYVTSRVPPGCEIYTWVPCGGSRTPRNVSLPTVPTTDTYQETQRKREYQELGAPCSGTHFDSTYSQAMELSDESPRPDLEETYEEALEDLPDDPNGTGITAIFWENLDYVNDRLDVVVQKAKLKLVHPPTPTCYLKVWVRKRFTPANGDPDTLTDVASYEWSGTGRPCLEDDEKWWLDPDNRITSVQTWELDVPEEPGVLTLEVKKYSFVQGYEPDNPLPDGSRPDPDNNPNAFPA